MLVINERTTTPRSEQRVLDWMRTWTGQYVIVGLAISGCYLPDHNGKGEAQKADLVVITPRAVVVVEVKGTTPEAMTGVLSVQANGRWRLSGFEGDPIHVRDHDSSPFDQVSSNVFNLEELVRKHDTDAFVDGLIVVVPPRDSNITLNIETRRRGCGVVLGSSPRELRAWFHRTASRKLVWTAERVHALLGDLNLADQVTLEDLVADGFPLERKLRAGKALATLESATREPRPVDDTPSPEISNASGVPANGDVPPAHSTVEQSDTAPIAPQLNESSGIQQAETDDMTDEDDQAVSAWQSPPLAAAHLRARSDVSESDVSEPAVSEPVASGATVQAGLESREWAARPPSALTDQQPLGTADVPEDGPVASAPESHYSEGLSTVGPARTQPAEPQPCAPEPYAPKPFVTGSVAPKSIAPKPSAPEHSVSNPLSSDPALDPAAQSASPLSSPFTDRWSSWIESDADRPLRPHPASLRSRPTPPPVPHRLPPRSTSITEARPLRRPTTPAIVERRPRIADRRRITPLLLSITGRASGQPRPIRHRPQQIAAAVLIAVIIGAIWLLAAACSTPHDDAVEQRPSPVSTTEVVGPPPTVAETPAPLNLLPLCLPFRSDC
ncbi:NERD domain-containing protein [Nocardia sp. NBC_00881]|uniref:nuclease-related domain-containing protein n=1 Tax=Nocardia sp. NBC_00881 TaxID=2975995 RepID=UPI0038680148|nr:NERD domain-containing protein [Nocardia sp. NBC_00881]